MNFSGKFWRGLAAGLAVLLVVWMILECQPLRRVDSAFHGLLRDMENKKWKAVSADIAGDYHDRWGFNHSSVMENLPAVFRHFYVLEIRADSPTISVADDGATVTSRILIKGSGTGIADLALGQIQALRQPFVFTFRKQSWKPWDWKLVSVEQPELEVAPSSEW